MNEYKPAFPVVIPEHNDGGVPLEYVEGMSLQDYFAAHVDIPWNTVLSLLRSNNISYNPSLEEIFKSRAKMRYMEADAMLKARDKGHA